MSYAKLFGSIVHSTVWQEDLHVKVVWITMIALKDRDGIVEASIPGLAKIAGVTIPQCEEALAKFLAPDKYSRTPDHEGRRIEVVDGGWRLLNADKYRDKLDADDQREKDAARKQRKRDELAAKGLTSRGQPASTASGCVPPLPVESRRIGHADAYTDQIREEEDLPSRARVREEQEECLHEPLGDLSLGDAISRRSREGSPESVPRLSTSSLEDQLSESADALNARQTLRKRSWGKLADLRTRVAAQLGLTPPRPLAAQDPGERALALRICEAPDLARAEADIDHVLAIAEAEAYASGSVQWLTGGMFEDRTWRRMLGMSPEDAKRSTGTQRRGARAAAGGDHPQRNEPDPRGRFKDL